MGVQKGRKYTDVILEQPLRYRNKFLCQNEPILNFPQEDPGQGQGVLSGQAQGDPDPGPVQPLDPASAEEPSYIIYILKTFTL